MPRRAPLWIALVTVAGAACARRAEAPSSPPPAALVGRCGGVVATEQACEAWDEAVAGCEGDAASHTSLPRLAPRASCYVAVDHRGSTPEPGPIPEGCGFPATLDAAKHLTAEAERMDAVAAGTMAPPLPLACDLPEDVLVSAARANAHTFRATARRIQRERFPYAAVATFGFGHGVMSGSALVPWRPEEGCQSLSKEEMDRLGVNRVRAGRAAAAWHGRVAPVVTVSGGAVHATLVEAFMLSHLLRCQFGVPADAILVDPCADHTHTNLRHTGSLVIQLGGRTAYVITDAGLQGQYLQDWTAFDLIGGSLDQRALRDWGSSLGSWHQASVGIDGGYWFTPYRFWGEPRDGLGGLTCSE